MDLNEIIIFMKVVQLGSFSKAAQDLNMPNSTVSTKIASLEQRLGIQLLHRTTRKLNLTEMGQLFFEKSLKGIDIIKTAETEVLLHHAKPQGKLLITAPTLLGSFFLPTIVAEYRKQYPHVSLELILTDRHVDLISENIDLAIRTGPLQDSSLMTKKIGFTCFSLFASQSYLREHGVPQHPRDLSKHQCLQFTPLGRDKWKLIHKNKTVFSVSLSQNMIVDDLFTIKHLAENGDGIALLPQFLCSLINQKDLVAILPGWHSEIKTVSFVYPQQKFVLPKLKQFIEIAIPLMQKQLTI